MSQFKHDSPEQIFTKLYAHYPALEQVKDGISRAFDLLCACYRGGGKVLACGNGGSAADCEHIVGELMKGFRLPRRLDEQQAGRFARMFPEEGGGASIARGLQGALPAISLPSQIGVLTAFQNDISAELAYSQLVYGYGRPGDVLIAISTSGNSENIVCAAKTARVCGVGVVGLTGQTGGALAGLSDAAVCVPATETYLIQELHLPVYHALCAALEAEFYPEPS